MTSKQTRDYGKQIHLIWMWEERKRWRRNRKTTKDSVSLGFGSLVFSLTTSCCSSSLNPALVISHGHSLVIKAYHLVSREVFVSFFQVWFIDTHSVSFPSHTFCVSCLRMRWYLTSNPAASYSWHCFCRDFRPLLCSLDRLKASVF